MPSLRDMSDEVFFYILQLANLCHLQISCPFQTRMSGANTARWDNENDKNPMIAPSRDDSIRISKVLLVEWKQFLNDICLMRSVCRYFRDLMRDRFGVEFIPDGVCLRFPFAREENGINSVSVTHRKTCHIKNKRQYVQRLMTLANTSPIRNPVLYLVGKRVLQNTGCKLENWDHGVYSTQLNVVSYDINALAEIAAKSKVMSGISFGDFGNLDNGELCAALKEYLEKRTRMRGRHNPTMSLRTFDVKVLTKKRERAEDAHQDPKNAKKYKLNK